MSDANSRCPEALYGHHGTANSNGNCPYCGERIARRRSYTVRSRVVDVFSRLTTPQGRRTEELRRNGTEWMTSYICPDCGREVPDGWRTDYCEKRDRNR